MFNLHCNTLFVVLLVMSVAQAFLSFYYFNATSIKGAGKLYDFNNSFSGTAYDVISITETWLHEGIYDAEILPHINYDIYRRDRNHDNSHKDTGGGVMLCINKQLPSIRRTDLESASMEILWVEIPIDKIRRAYIAAVYMPRPTNDIMDAFEQSISKLNLIVKPSDTVIITGDMNLNDISWKRHPQYHYACVENRDSISAISDRFLDILSFGDLQQYNTEATTEPSRDRSNSNTHVLDLVVANDINNIKTHLVQNATSSTHYALEVSVPLKINVKSTTPKGSGYNYWKADWEHVYSLLSCFSWLDWNCFTNVDEAFNHFYDIVHGIIRESVPTFKASSKVFPKWYDKELRYLIKLKDRCHKSYLRTGRETQSASYQLFSQLRKQVKLKQKQCYNVHIKNIEAEIAHSTKRFWTHVKSKKANGIIPKSMKYKENVYTSDDSIVNAFSLFFKSVFIQYDTNYTPSYCSTSEIPVFRMPKISSDDVRNILRSLEPTTATGSDNIPAIFFIRCADHISKPIADLYNLSVANGEYPSMLKRDNVLPIYKRKGSKNDVECYRGISLQPIIAKVFEGFVNRSLRQHVNSYIVENQHGFVPSKSCSTNLLCYTDYITKTFDNKNQIHSIYTDFRKAFDIVPHHLLLHKINKQFGIEGSSYAWFESYLSDRYQRVIINGVQSEWYAAPSGVPQGSVIGPTLFIMYINDVLPCLKYSKLLLFADDAKIFKEISSPNDCLLLQTDIDNFFNWCSMWRMQLNVDKCYFINFSLKRKYDITFNYSINRTDLSEVNEIKDLGVYFTSNLNFSLHIKKTVSKAYQMLGFIKRVTKDFTDSRTFYSLYNAYVRSKLDYCSQVWSPADSTSINKIEGVQKRFLKYVCYKQKVMYYNYDYSSLCTKFNMTTLEKRRNICDATFLNKLMQNKLNCPYLNNEISYRIPVRNARILRSSRSRPTFYVEYRLLCRKHSFLPRVLDLANRFSLYDHLIHKNPAVFKCFIKSEL